MLDIRIKQKICRYVDRVKIHKQSGKRVVDDEEEQTEKQNLMPFC